MTMCGPPSFLPGPRLNPRLNQTPACVAGHQVGHGQSGGIRVDVTDFAIYARDVAVDIKATRARFPGGSFRLVFLSVRLCAAPWRR